MTKDDTDPGKEFLLVDLAKLKEDYDLNLEEDLSVKKDTTAQKFNLELAVDSCISFSGYVSPFLRNSLESLSKHLNENLFLKDLNEEKKREIKSRLIQNLFLTLSNLHGILSSQKINEWREEGLNKFYNIRDLSELEASLDYFALNNLQKLGKVLRTYKIQMASAEEVFREKETKLEQEKKSHRFCYSSVAVASASLGLILALRFLPSSPISSYEAITHKSAQISTLVKLNSKQQEQIRQDVQEIEAQRNENYNLEIRLKEAKENAQINPSAFYNTEKITSPKLKKLIKEKIELIQQIEKLNSEITWLNAFYAPDFVRNVHQEYVLAEQKKTINRLEAENQFSESYWVTLTRLIEADKYSVLIKKERETFEGLISDIKKAKDQETEAYQKEITNCLGENTKLSEANAGLEENLGTRDSSLKETISGYNQRKAELKRLSKQRIAQCQSDNDQLKKKIIGLEKKVTFVNQYEADRRAAQQCDLPYIKKASLIYFKKINQAAKNQGVKVRLGPADFALGIARDLATAPCFKNNYQEIKKYILTHHK